MILDISNYIANQICTGVICRESASFFHKLSTFPSRPIIFYARVYEKIESTYLVMLPVNDLDLSHTIKIREGLYITDIERTVCELIKYGSEDNFIYESLESCLDTSIIEGIKKLAFEYGIFDKLYFYLSTLSEYFTE